MERDQWYHIISGEREVQEHPQIHGEESEGFAGLHIAHAYIDVAQKVGLVFEA